MAKSICNDSLKVTSLIVFGIFLVISAFMSYICLPFLVEHIVKQKLILSPESMTFSDWRKVPTPIYTHFYFFNVTNPTEVELFGAKPIVNELGPYTYHEEREKINIDWDNENGTVAYEQVRRWHFMPDKSKGSLDDKVIFLNVPLVSAGDAARKLGGDFFYQAINTIAYDANETLFKASTVEKLLFEGVDAYMIEAAAQIGVHVPYDKFGWFYKKNNTAFDGTYRIFSGQAGTVEKLGLMNSWNNNDQVNYWKGLPCRRLDRSSPGDLRPPFARTRPDHIFVFAADICRTLPLTFLSEVEYNGLKTNRYWAEPKVFDYGCTDNQCFCPERGCPASGVFNSSLCTHDSPSAVSLPHFLYADSQYTEMVGGLKPDASRHSFYLDLDPNLGVVVRAAARLQVNIVLEKDVHLEFTEKLQHNQIYYPMFWFETIVNLGEDHIKDLVRLQKVPQYITLSALLQLGLALIILLGTFVYSLRLKNSKKSAKPPKPSRNQYQAVRIVSTSFEK